MPMVPLKQLLDEATKKGYGVGAFNVNNMEQIQAIARAADATNSPVIVQASKGALKYSDMIFLKKLMEAAVEKYPKIKFALHLDHGNSLKTCQDAIALGFTSVMIDASLMEDGKSIATYEYNVETTKSVVTYAHQFGVSVEAELGALGGIEDGHGAGLAVDDTTHLTDPNQVVDFVKKTGCDCLAVAIGTSHGAYKTLRYDKDGKPLPPSLALDRIEQVEKKLAEAGFPNFPLVMHGSSSVPEDLVEMVNKYGGHMKKAMGVPMKDIQFGIQRGVRKINVDTDGRIAVTAAIRKVFAETPEKFDPRDYLGPARDTLQKVIEGKMKDFGQAGHNDDFEPLTLEDMKKVYAAGAKGSKGSKGGCGCGCS